MIILAAETSTKNGSAALTRDGVLLGEKVNENQRSHSEVLHQFFADLLMENNLQIKDVDIFAASLGPGSFTGLRIAGNAIKTYACALNRPMYATDSLTLMAEAFPENGLISPWINAYKNMVYRALFEKSGGVLKMLEAPTVCRVQDLAQTAKSKFWVLGDGYRVYGEFLPEKIKNLCLRPSSEKFDFPRASTLASLAFRASNEGHTIDWNSFQPLYIRASEAEENLSGIRFSSLN